jgi:hypothetical protein
MTIDAARHELMRIKALDVLKAAGFDESFCDRVENGMKAKELMDATISMMQMGAEESAAKNYVSITMEGLVVPFERAEITLVRKGKKSPRDLQLDAEDRASRLETVMIALVCELEHVKPDSPFLKSARRALGKDPDERLSADESEVTP